MNVSIEDKTIKLPSKWWGQAKQGWNQKHDSRCKKYKGEDEENRNKFDSKNSLENYVHNYEKLHYGWEIYKQIDPINKKWVDDEIDVTI